MPSFAPQRPKIKKVSRLLQPPLATMTLRNWRGRPKVLMGETLTLLPLPSPFPSRLEYMPVYPWQQVYKAAVLERDPAKLEEFVQSAFTVIYEHLRARGDITAEESEALLDALHALERLQKSKPGQSRRAA